MGKAPAFQFYPGDRLRELMPIMNDSEAVGAWCKAWMYLWGAGPTKPEVLAQVAGKGWDRVGFLFREENGLLSLEWMEEKRAETAAFKDRQSKNGRKGGRPKRNVDAAQNPSLSSGITQKKPKQSPRVEGEGGVEEEVEDERGSRQERAHEPEVEPTFKQWFDLYDKRKALGECQVKWRTIDQGTREAIMAHTARLVATTPKEYRKDPIRYLTKRGWEDEIIQRTSTTTATIPKHMTDEEYVRESARVAYEAHQRRTAAAAQS